MLDPEGTLNEFRKGGVTCFTGVPDSLLKHFCAAVSQQTNPSEHLITANEGAAVALAAGHFLATGELALVYLQNSGLGNAVNPLLSLADPSVYAIPMVLLVGWRGEPEVNDEPQHLKQGRVMEPLLASLGFPFEVLSQEKERATDQISWACRVAAEQATPVVLLVRRGSFQPYSLVRKQRGPVPSIAREDAIRALLHAVSRDHVLVSTTGMTSRELFELREARGESPAHDFLTVGSMGHCSQVALGIALRKPGLEVICLDGDGSVIMHMGSLAIIGTHAPRNFKHLILNNGAHDSVGGQPTAGFDIDLPAIAKGCGYRQAASIEAREGVHDEVEGLLRAEGPALLEIRIARGARPNLGRPTDSPVERRNALMRYLKAEG